MRLEEGGAKLFVSREEATNLFKALCTIKQLALAIERNNVYGLYLDGEPITIPHLELMIDKLKLLCGSYKELS